MLMLPLDHNRAISKQMYKISGLLSAILEKNTMIVMFVFCFNTTADAAERSVSW